MELWGDIVPTILADYAVTDRVGRQSSSQVREICRRRKVVQHALRHVPRSVRTLKSVAASWMQEFHLLAIVAHGIVAVVSLLGSGYGAQGTELSSPGYCI